MLIDGLFILSSAIGFLLLITWLYATVACLYHNQLIKGIKEDFWYFIKMTTITFGLLVWPTLFLTAEKEYDLHDVMMYQLHMGQDDIQKFPFLENYNEKITCIYGVDDKKSHTVVLNDIFHLTYNKDVLKFFCDGKEFDEKKVKYKVYKNKTVYGVHVRNMLVDELIYE